MGNIDYKSIYNRQRSDWKKLTNNNSDENYDMLVAGHYSENNHFVYEILQNAEDAGATRITFVYCETELRVYHNGKPFDQNDVDGVCSLLTGTKNKDDSQTIGHFGLGFKSVYKYTDEPRIYSDGEAFKIENYLLPVEIEFENFTNYAINDEGEIQELDFRNEHTTSFVLPYKTEILQKTSTVKSEDIIKKLAELEPEILLFLKNITRLEWIDNTTGRHGYYNKSEPENKSFKGTDEYCDITCTAFDSSLMTDPEESMNEKKNKPIVSSYIRINRKITEHNDDAKNSNISIAYKLNSTKAGITKTTNSTIWVFFPTRDDSDLPLLIHGTYETPVSREKIVFPSAYNEILFTETTNLIVDSLSYLKERKLLTQQYIKEVLLPSFNNKYLKDLKELVRVAFTKEAFLPDPDGRYTTIEKALVAVPFDLPKVLTPEVIRNTQYKDYVFISFTDVNNSVQYLKWLDEVLEVRIFTIEDFACLLASNPIEHFGEYIPLLEYLNKSLSSFRSSHFQRRPRFSNNALYCDVLSASIEDAIHILKKSNIILTKAGTYSVTIDEFDKPLLYFESENDFKIMPDTQIVDTSLVENSNIKSMLSFNFEIKKCDNKEYVEQYIVPKYRIDPVNKINKLPNDDNEHISDIKAILSVVKDYKMSQEKIEEFLYGTYLLQIKSTKDGSTYYTKGTSYFSKSKEGIDIEEYFKNIEDIFIVKDAFYKEHGIEYEDLIKLGVCDSILLDESIINGECQTGNPGKKPSWRTNGDFRWKLTLDQLEEVLDYIYENPEHPSSIHKSSIIMKILQNNEHRLFGTAYVTGESIPHYENIYSQVVESLCEKKWIYTKDRELVSASEISKYDLDENLYGSLRLDSKLYSLLGFAIGNADKIEANSKDYDAMPIEKRDFIFQMYLENNFHISIDDLKQISKSTQQSLDTKRCSREEEFEFPSYPVKNMEYLIRHITQDVYCANPVAYEQITRSIRVSKDTLSSRTYLENMYSVMNNQYACQMCAKPVASYEAVQLEETTSLELEQMHICLCPTCATQFRAYRSNPSIQRGFLEDILDTDYDQEEAISIPIGNDDSQIRFTQTHLAEVKEIMLLQNKQDNLSK